MFIDYSSAFKSYYRSLVVIYTDDVKSSSSLFSLFKYSDDSALADFSHSDSNFNQQVTQVTKWCKNIYLELNVDKTKEMVVDLRKKRHVGEAIIEGAEVLMSIHI